MTAILLVMAGCGYVGDPQPPALNIPQQIPDLTATQRGDKLRLTFTLPKMTTEGLAIRKRGEVEIRVGLLPESGFDVNNWAPTARRIPIEPPEAGVALVEAPVGDFAGRQVFAVVRSAGPSGRWSPWSNVQFIRVVKAISQPAYLEAHSDPAGVRLTWRGDPALRYRIFRQAPKEEDFSLLGEAQGPAFLDDKAEFGQSYNYRVQAFQKVEDQEAESEVSGAVSLTPEDSFVPAIPSGINALIGVNTVELAWERNTEKDFRGYNVYRSPENSREPERIASLLDSPSYSDKMVEAGKTYRYFLTAVDQAGNESAKSPPTIVAIRQ
ncbi:MAG TPA: hypothetical protein VM120_06395 [Bryobacteraceae bacterium]|nr:hypothetical protein [Bryobacteraceae bacterium]